MQRFIKLATIVFIGVGLALAQKAYTPKIDPMKIRDAVQYLSSDELQGRGTGQPGGDAAADFVHDAAVLERLQRGSGSLVRVNGSWKDF